jgi:acyl CoA:acetate/3-ketoacid CoA transferase alpha subunit/acyl CoA:acetate/3-ketoacid CoA transferase beta subunit
MTGRFDDLIATTFALPENEGQNKVMDLREAVARHVRPGARIHIAATHCCSHAAILEIARRFHGTRPEFTLIMRGIRDTVTILLHMGLLKKVITSFSGNVYPWYSPNPVCQKAYAERAVELEEWTILTFPLRLMAGALGVPAMPTRSLIGSSLAESNPANFRRIDDPFGGDRPLGLVKALNPDISIVHGVAADREGNTILTAPYSESLWGAKASTGGVLVTVEKLVSTDFIRRHAHLVKLPAYMVQSVSVVPLGAHPGGVWHQGLADFEPYTEDYAFMTEFNRACKDPKALDAWIDEWVLSCPDFAAYTAKLGADRALNLKGGTHKDAWRYQLAEVQADISESPMPNATERMVVAAARLIQERARDAGHRTMLAGAGTANLAAWLAKYQLQKEGFLIELMVELGYFGNAPRPAEPFLLNFGNFATCKMLTETLDTLGVFTCGATNRCLGVLGAAQIDRFGNINSNWAADDLYITGSGGANDVATGACETMVIMQQSRRRFLEKVPFVTAPGDRIRTLVSSMGVFEKRGDDRTFTLTRVFADPAGAGIAERVEKIRAACGWPLRIADTMTEVAPPTMDELRLLRVFDPKSYYLK